MTTLIGHSTRVTLVTLLLLATPLASAAPAITSWESSGGTTQNKDSAQDIMYLVQSGDTISFSVTATGASGYSWYVNKAEQGVNAATLAWTVPNEKGVWEVRVEAYAGTDRVFKEWVVSTMLGTEAPGLFEYFADGKIEGRTETDPWARPLPEWVRVSGTPDARNGFLAPAGDYTLGAGAAITRGTWRIRYRMPLGDHYGVGSYWYWYLISAAANPAAPYVRIWEDVGSHSWLAWEPPSPQYVHHMAYTHGLTESSYGQIESRGNGWIDVVIIRTDDDYWYVFRKMPIALPLIPEIGNRARLVGGMPDRWIVQDESADLFTVLANVYSTSNPIELDNIEAYQGKVLWPNEEKVIVFSASAPDFAIEDAAIPKVPNLGGDLPWGYAKMHGIVVDGRGVRLEDIANAIADANLFEYNRATRTAITHTNIALLPAAQLMIENETLLFVDGGSGLKMRLLRGSELRAVNSVIDSPGGNCWAMDFYYRFKAGGPDHAEPSEAGVYHYTGSHNFIHLDGTVVKNSCGWKIEDPQRLSIKDTRFIDMVPDEDGYLLVVAYSLAQTDLVQVDNMTLKSKKGVGKMMFKGGDVVTDIQVLNSAIDAEVELAGLDWYGTRDGRELNLVNTTIGGFSFASDKTRLILKNYLDVQVQNAAGDPIAGATVTVSNDTDSVLTSQNLETDHVYGSIVDRFGHGGGGHNVQIRRPSVNRYTEANKKTSFITGPDGHTPLPADASNTAVLIDQRHDNWDGALVPTNYFYTISAEGLDGKRCSAAAVDPGQAWYRPDPQVPSCTVKITVADPCPPAEVSCQEYGTIAGRVRAGNALVEGATVESGATLTTTDAAGGYRLGSLAAGHHVVTASRAGYGSQTKEADVALRQILRLDFELAPPTAEDGGREDGKTEERDSGSDPEMEVDHGDGGADPGGAETDHPPLVSGSCGCASRSSGGPPAWPILLLFLVPVRSKYCRSRRPTTLGPTILAACLSSAAGATEYYVAPGGDNAGPGLSPGEAWATPSYAAERAEAGDTIFLMAGTWKDDPVVFRNSGSEKAPIVLRAYDGTATLEGPGADSGTGITVAGKRFIQIENLNIVSFLTGIDIKTGSAKIVVRGSNFRDIDGIGVSIQGDGWGSITDVTVSDSTFLETAAKPPDAAIMVGWSNNVALINNRITHTKGGWGYRFYRTSNVVIDGTYVANIPSDRNIKLESGQPPATCSDYYSNVNWTIRNSFVGDSPGSRIFFVDYCNKDIFVENNTFVGDGTTVEHIDWYPFMTGRVVGNRFKDLVFQPLDDELTIEGNVFENVQFSMGYSVGLYHQPSYVFRGNVIVGVGPGSGDFFEGWRDSEVSNNIFFNTRGLVWRDNSFRNVTIKNNVWYNIGGGNGVAIEIGPSSDGILFKNNIFMNLGTAVRNAAGGEGVIARYNLVFDNTAEAFASVQVTDTMTTDPLFADPGTGDFHLRSHAGRWTEAGWVLDHETSPAIDAGDPADDFSKEPPPNGGRINLGAYGNTEQASKTPEGPDFRVSCDPATLIVAPGETGETICGVFSILGFAGTVAMSCSGLPAEAGCEFNPSEVTLPFGSQGTALAVPVAGSAGAGRYPFQAVGTAGGRSRLFPMIVVVELDQESDAAGDDGGKDGSGGGEEEGAGSDPGNPIASASGCGCGRESTGWESDAIVAGLLLLGIATTRRRERPRKRRAA